MTILGLCLVVKIYSMKEEGVDSKKLDQPYAKKFNGMTCLKYLGRCVVTFGGIFVVRELHRKGLNGIKNLPQYLKDIASNKADLLIPSLLALSIMGSIAMVKQTFRPREINIEGAVKKSINKIDTSINNLKKNINSYNDLINNVLTNNEDQESYNNKKEVCQVQLKNLETDKKNILDLSNKFNDTFYNFQNHVVDSVNKYVESDINILDKINEFFTKVSDDFNEKKAEWVR